MSSANEAEAARLRRITEWMELPFESESDGGDGHDRASSPSYTRLVEYGRRRIRHQLQTYDNLVNVRPAAAASEAAIEAMPRVAVAEQGVECSICLARLEAGAEAREMPCNHRFHSSCIEAWLRRRGTCPICRFSVPQEKRRRIEFGFQS